MSLPALRNGFSAKGAPHDGIRTTDARPNLDRPEGAVAGTGPAFHAPIPIRYARLTLFHFEYGMRTDGHAHSAARAFCRIIFQGDDVFEIF